MAQINALQEKLKKDGKCAMKTVLKAAKMLFKCCLRVFSLLFIASLATFFLHMFMPIEVESTIKFFNIFNVLK